VRSSAEQSRRARRASEFERRAVLAIAAVAAVAAAFSSAAPTSFGVVNVLLRAGFAFLVTVATSRARRWTWLVMVGVVEIGSQGVWLLVAAAALLIALAASLLSRRRWYGALAGAMAVQALLRFGELGFPLGSALVAAVAVTPMFVSAYLVSPRRIRRRVHLGLAAAAGVALAGTAVFGLAALLAVSSVNKAKDEARAGLVAVHEGRTDRAAELMAQARDDFDRAHGLVGSWWAAPGRAVPIVAPHADAVITVTASGERVSDTAARTAGGVQYQSLRYKSGQVDLDRLRAMREPLRQTADSFQAALDEVRAIRSPWLLDVVAGQVDEFTDQLDDAAHESQLAAQASEVLPGMLGGDGPRRYFIAFTTPAEERGLGGFMGSWAELTAVDGKLSISRSGRAADLNAVSRATTDGRVTVDVDYANRYNRLFPGHYLQDVTLSPDMPTVAKVIGELYPKAGGERLDGVLVIDPEGLAALLELTGPIKMDGLDTPLSSRNAVEFLTVTQYREFESRGQREGFLEDAGRKTFEKLVRSDLPGPSKLGDVLGPVVKRQRIMFTSLHFGEEQELVDQLGAGGEFPRPDGGDFFSLRTQNKGNNKIDVFLERRIEYKATVDPATGALTAHVDIELHNAAPASGLPDAVLRSNDQPYPLGTNVLYFSFYTPHGLKEAKVAGTATGLEFQRELGYSVYSKFLAIPPGESLTVSLELFGTVTTDGGLYRLTVSPQPMINPDHVIASVEAPPGYVLSSRRLGRDPGFPVEPGGFKAVFADTPERRVTLAVGIAQR
jgi:hypothetical protein